MALTTRSQATEPVSRKKSVSKKAPAPPLKASTAKVTKAKKTTKSAKTASKKSRKTTKKAAVNGENQVTGVATSVTGYSPTLPGHRHFDGLANGPGRAKSSSPTFRKRSVFDASKRWRERGGNPAVPRPLIQPVADPEMSTEEFRAKEVMYYTHVVAQSEIYIHLLSSMLDRVKEETAEAFQGFRELTEELMEELYEVGADNSEMLQSYVVSMLA